MDSQRRLARGRLGVLAHQRHHLAGLRSDVFSGGGPGLPLSGDSAQRGLVVEPLASSQLTEDRHGHRSDVELLEWSDVHKRAARLCSHYKAILERDPSDDQFGRKVRGVQMTRSILGTGFSYRTRDKRREGLGSQD